MSATRSVEFDVKDIGLAGHGKQRTSGLKEKCLFCDLSENAFAEEKPLSGTKLVACAHITTETAKSARALQAGGADAVLIASNPLSTQDDVAASLVSDWEFLSMQSKASRLRPTTVTSELLLIAHPTSSSMMALMWLALFERTCGAS